MLFNLRRPAVYASVAIATAFVAQSASGAPIEFSNEVPQRTVKFADLDITHGTGAAVMYLRITRAAHEVCDPTSWTWVNDARQCREQAIERAVGDVNEPALTSYHQMMKAYSAADRR